eukprot:3496767-Amphidinium_carterae.1
MSGRLRGSHINSHLTLHIEIIAALFSEAIATHSHRPREPTRPSSRRADLLLMRARADFSELQLADSCPSVDLSPDAASKTFPFSGFAPEAFRSFVEFAWVV